MTTIVEALNRIARQCSVSVPSSWVTATRQDHVELRDDFLMETVSDITDRVDLPGPVAGRVLSGDLSAAGDGGVLFGSPIAPGTSGSIFSLPDDFKRLQRHENTVYDTGQDRQCVPISRDGNWEYIEDTGTTGVFTYYRLSGYDGNWTIEFQSNTAAPDDIVISYITTAWMANSAGVPGATFSDETDVLIFPRKVVEAGTVWRCRERRGLPYLDKYNEYEALVARLSNDSRVRRVVSFGEPETGRSWMDYVPAFIPSS